ncbi:MAG: hypothetical protein E3J42_05815 [Dehalococcoidia bacterium]|nr:MAG: hypothetical protein E3J42_05815 [Dehalococcoidia bacterium]
MVKQIASELKRHAPFTAFGAVTGIIVMVIIVFGNFLSQISPISQDIFYVLHPTHVFLSALVTTSLYVRYGKRKIWLAVLIGYTGSIGIATLSDSIIPYVGETLLDLPNRGIHIGFIEEPMLTNPVAFLGIAIGYWRPITRFPHAGHVLLSTWASLFHIIMALGQTLSWIQVLAILLFLFLAVWIPCCVSDIVYPVLFTRGRAPMLKEVKPA